MAVENTEKPSKKRSLLQESPMFISVFLCALLMVTEGSNEAWASTLLQKLNGTEDNPLGNPVTETEYSFIAALSIPGALSGALVAGLTSQRFGRKTLLTVCAFPSLISSLIMILTKTVWVFFIAKFIQGIGLGGVMAVMPMYICEISEPELRGRLTAYTGVATCLGKLLTFSLGANIPFKWYHISMSLFPLSFLILFPFFGIESPYYLLQRKPEEAEKVLKKLRGSNDVSEELNEIKRSLKNKTSKGTLLDVLKTRGTRKALFIGLSLASFSLLTGTLIIMAYATFIFNQAGGSWSGKDETIAIGVVLLVSSLCTSTISDRFGRKPLLTTSYLGVAISEGALALYLMLQNSGTDVSRFDWLPLCCLTCYVISMNIGVSSIQPAVMGELFPLRVKAAALSFCAMYFLCLGFITRFLFQTIIDSIGLGQTFMLFAAFGVLASIFVTIFLVESRGKTLEEVQDELNGNKEKDVEEKRERIDNLPST